MANRPSTVTYRASVLADAREIVEAEYAQPLVLDDVARRIATSRRQLQRAFLEIGGTTFRAYLAEVRMRKAAELLRSEPGLPIREVARRVGYRQPAQFAKTFRRHMGKAPVEYRTAQREGAADLPVAA